MHDLTDKKDIEEQEIKAKIIRDRELNDIRAVLSTNAGRRFVWKLLERCKAFGSIYDSDSKFMAYLSGQQDLGHYIMAEITETDENLLFKLMKENKKGERNE